MRQIETMRFVHTTAKTCIVLMQMYYFATFLTWDGQESDKNILRKDVITLFTAKIGYALVFPVHLSKFCRLCGHIGIIFQQHAVFYPKCPWYCCCRWSVASGRLSIFSVRRQNGYVSVDEAEGAAASATRNYA